MTGASGPLDALPGISLSELERDAALMSRVDRKYLVPRDLLDDLLRRAALGTRVLEIDGRRSFRYRSVYFDTAGFRFFRQHVQHRRHRFKVRTRTYLDSGGCQLEVKSKGRRGLTVKQRIAQDATRPYELDDAGRAFVSAVTGADAAPLIPVLRTDYLRSTLVHRDQRVTLDSRLVFSAGGRVVTGPPEVLVETKTPGTASALDRMLVRSGIRPHRVSKYCLAASLLYPHLAGNDWSRIRRRFWDGAAAETPAAAARPLR